MGVKKAARKRGPNTSDLLEMMVAMQEQIAKLSERMETQAQSEEERQAAWEAEQDRIAREKYDQQQKNRGNPELIKKLLAPRDPSVIRGMKGDDLIRVVTLARIGLGENEEGENITTDIDETVDITREAAQRLQDAGKVKIAL